MSENTASAAPVDPTGGSSITAEAASAELWDFIVIGGGTAGLVASRTAARFGSRVLLIEEHQLGGDCLWFGCVPSKSLIAAASAATIAQRSTHLGITATGVTVDFGRVMRHVRDARVTIAPVDSAEALHRDGVEVLHGRAMFTGPRTVDVAGHSIGFAQAMIATGGSPSVPELPGADLANIRTSTTFWDITDLPANLVVLGGGAIGCEIAQAMARLGSKVTLVHRGDRILPKEDPKAAAIVTAALIEDGVTLRLERSTDSFEADAVLLDDGTRLPADLILAAIGRRSNTAGLGVDAAGVDLDDKGNVHVDDKLRSSNPRIWAAGDVSGLPQFTHTAGVNGSIAAANSSLGISRTIDSAAVPRVTYTHPEVAAVGVQPSEAQKAGYEVVTIEHHDLDRAIAEAETSGFTQLVIDGKGRIFGGLVVSPRAGETLGELSIAVKSGLTTGQIAGTTHAYPTFNDAVWLAAVADVQKRLKVGLVGGATKVLHAIRSRRVR